MPRPARLRGTALLLGLALALAGLPGAAAAARPTGRVITLDHAIPGRYIVSLKAGRATTAAATRASARRLAAGHDVTVGSTFTGVLDGFATRDTTPAEAQRLADDPAVASVTTDAVPQPAGIQEGPSIGLDRIDQRSLPLDQRYRSTDRVDGAGVDVYVVDSGLNYDHEEFGGRAVPGFDVTGRDGIGDGDGDPGDPSTGPDNPNDKHDGRDCAGHGTKTAGILGGKTYGVARGATLISARIFDCDELGTVAGFIEALEWIKARPRPRPAVVHLGISIGVVPGLPDLVPSDLAAKALVGAGMTVVVPAGNRGIDAGDSSPGRVPEVITVGGLGGNDARWVAPQGSSSNWGDRIDVFAPAASIVTAAPAGTSSTTLADGTSFAGPFVAGVAAKYLQVNPDAPPADVSAAIVADATTGKVTDARSPNRLLYDPPNPDARGSLTVSGSTASGWADDRSCPGATRVSFYAEPGGGGSPYLAGTTGAATALAGHGGHGFLFNLGMPAGTRVRAFAEGLGNDCAPDGEGRELTGSPFVAGGAFTPGTPPAGRQVNVPVGQRDGLTTGIQVLNAASGTAAAMVEYVEPGPENVVRASHLIRVPGGGSVTRLEAGPDQSTREPGRRWSGSVRITALDGSDKLSAVSNHVAGSAVSSSTAPGNGASEVLLPLLQHGNSGTDSWAAIQNTGTRSSQVTVTYSYGQAVSDTVRPGESWIVDQKTAPGSPPIAFSATVTSPDAPVVATVFQQSPAAAGKQATLLEYTGFARAEAAANLAAPLVVAANFGAMTGIQVQNAGSAAAKITVTYGPNTVTGANLCNPVSASQDNIQPGTSATFLQTGRPAPDPARPDLDPQFAGGCRYVGSATITSADASGRPQPMVAVVNQVGNGSSTYEAFDTAKLGGVVNLPLAQANNYGVISGIQIQNAGDAATDVTVTFGPNVAPPPPPGATNCPSPPHVPPFNLAARKSETILLPDFTAGKTTGFSCTWVGSVTVTGGSGAKLAALVNQASVSNPEALSTYGGR